MSENKSVIFKSALGGYNKNDVNAYLAAVSAEMKSNEEMHKLQCARLEKEAENERNEKAVISSKLDELGCELFGACSDLEVEKNKNAELEGSVAQLSQRTAELEREIEEKSNVANEALLKLDEAELRIKELEETLLQIDDARKNAPSGNDDITEKAMLYDKLSERLGEIMLTANSSAEEIMTGAMNHGDEVIANARAEAEKIKKEASLEAEKLREHYKNAASEYYEEVQMFASDIHDYLENFVREVGSKSAEFENKINYLRISEVQPEMPEITSECLEKEVNEEKSESDADGDDSGLNDSDRAEKRKKSYSAIEEKVEHFFKSTMATINAFKKR